MVRLVCWLAGCVACWLVGWLVGLLVGWLAVWLGGWVVGCCGVGWLLAWLAVVRDPRGCLGSALGVLYLDRESSVMQQADVANCLT